MAMRTRKKRRLWKTINISSSDDIRTLQSCWQNFSTTRTYHMDMIRGPGGGIIETNLPIKQIEKLFRFAGVVLPDYVKDTKPSTDDEEGDL